jgi:triacylglycerol lipase
MVSRWLRATLAIEAILVIIATMASLGGALTFTAVLATCAAVLILSICVVATAYAVLRIYALKVPVAGADHRKRTWRCAFVEVLALFAAFAVIQPFERWWMGADAVGPLVPGRLPVLLVHGYLCNRGLWWWLRRRLRARGFAVATINLEPPFDGLDHLAVVLGERIDALLAEARAEKVILATHSMGGLVSRAYLKRYGETRVAGLVTLAAPHHGTHAARLGVGRNAREMRPNSDWLSSLNAQPPPSIRIASIWTLDDEIITPPNTSHLARARETVLSELGHIAMVFSPRVLARLEAELTYFSNG